MKDQAIVVPPKGGRMIYKQSRFEHLAPTPFRVIAAGRSGSGKTSALYSAVTDFYKGCFKRLVIIARTAKLDHSYIQLREWAEKHLKQDNRERPFVFTWMDLPYLRRMCQNTSRYYKKFIRFLYISISEL